MELKQIQDLIKFVAKSGVDEVELEKGNFKITIRSNARKEESDHPQPHYMYPPAGMMPAGMMQAPQQAAPQAAPQGGEQSAEAKSAEKEEAAASNQIEVKAPMIGTFYRAPGPDKDVFVKVGDVVKAGQVVCIIEAMKLFNEIESEVEGKIVKVLVDDAAPVEYGQPLFLVEPV